MNNEIITVGTQKNGLIVYKKENVVGGFTYYSEENSPSDIGALPVVDDCLVSIEVMEIILNDMKKAPHKQLNTMRDIKFRAWDIYTNQMIATGFDVLGEVTCFNLIEQWLREHPKENTPSLIRINDVVLMQFTGLLDKNGKEIYEGDIVRCSDYIEDAQAMNEWVREINFKGGCFIGVDGEVNEIIGNIYEHPHLLYL